MKNLYEILGVDKTADAAALKRAYRTLAKELHPDATGGNRRKTERFKEVCAAYAILSDSKKRADYDLTDKPGVGGKPGARESIFGPQFDDLVSRVQTEGIGTHNIDALIADLFGVAHDVQKRAPERARTAMKSPSGVLDLVEDLLDRKIAWDKKKQG